MKSILGFICLAVLLLEACCNDNSDCTVVTWPDPIQVAVVVDQPWAYASDSCLKNATDEASQNPCYYGLLLDVLNKIQEDLKFNYTIELFSEFGLDNSTNPSEWTGLKGALINKKVDMALAMLNVTEESKKVLDFSYPIYEIERTEKNQTLALGFPKGSALTPAFSHMVHKLSNQRHLEQLIERWFNENTNPNFEKQLTHRY